MKKLTLLLIFSLLIFTGCEPVKISLSNDIVYSRSDAEIKLDMKLKCQEVCKISYYSFKDQRKTYSVLTPLYTYSNTYNSCIIANGAILEGKNTFTDYVYEIQNCYNLDLIALSSKAEQSMVVGYMSNEELFKIRNKEFK